MPAAPRDPALRFGVPPSGGLVAGDERLESLAELLRTAVGGEVTIALASSYQDLGRRMQFGELDLCWAPPFVCARLEALGFAVLLRGVRNGASTYRSALLAANPAATVPWLKGKRPAWIDRDSVSGYLLPLAFLKGE